jgi:hypothetical protein
LDPEATLSPENWAAVWAKAIQRGADTCVCVPQPMLGHAPEVVTTAGRHSAEPEPASAPLLLLPSAMVRGRLGLRPGSIVRVVGCSLSCAVAPLATFASVGMRVARLKITHFWVSSESRARGTDLCGDSPGWFGGAAEKGVEVYALV